MKAHHILNLLVKQETSKMIKRHKEIHYLTKPRIHYNGLQDKPSRAKTHEES